MTAPFSVTLYGYDAGPWNNLKLVAAAAERRGWTVKSLGGKPLGEPGQFLAPRPNVLITGLSSFQSAEELALGEAADKLGIPWIVIADTHESFARPPAKGRVRHAVAVVASVLEVEPARNFGYHEAVYLDGPPAWQEFWQTDFTGEPGLMPTIYIGGVKSVPVTNELLQAAVGGVKRAHPYDWQLIFRPHPNEGTGPDAPENEVEARAWREQRREILAGVALLKPDATGLASDISSTEAFGVAHASFFTSGSTETIRGAIKRRLVGYFESPKIRERMAAQSGKETWWPAEVGAVIKVTTAAEVGLTLHMTRGEATPASLRLRQETAYPKPAIIGQVETRILDFTLGFAL